MRPLRIVHVAGSAQWAGGEVFLQQMADKLDRSVFDFRVICPEEGPLQAEMEKRGVPCRTVLLEPLGDPRPINALADVFKEWEADVVQSHGARSNFYTRLAAGSRFPNISTIHNALGDYPVPFLKKKIYGLMDKVSSRRCTAVVCVAEALREELLSRIPGLRSKTRVIHNGVDFSRYDPRLYDRNNIRASLELNARWTLGVIGRMTDQKGHVFLLEAVRAMKSALPPFHLLLVGDGPLRPNLEERVKRLGLQDVCRFLGVRQDIPEILCALDVVVMPSVSEGFPYVLLEALAMKRPVVASHVNGVGEIIATGQEGYLVPPRSPGPLGEAIRRVAAQPREAMERAERGWQRVRGEFSAETFLSRWQELYRELAHPEKR